MVVLEDGRATVALQVMKITSGEAFEKACSGQLCWLCLQAAISGNPWQTICLRQGLQQCTWYDAQHQPDPQAYLSA